MSDENETHENSDSNGIANLRKQYEEQKKQNDALLAELNSFRSEKRQATVAEVLKAKGVSPAAAKLYSGEDVSEDAVGKWLEENADVFGAPSKQIDPNEADAARVAAASFGNTAGVQQDPAPGQVLGDPEQILHAIKTLPYEDLQKLGIMPQDKGQLFNSGRRS